MNNGRSIKQNAWADVLPNFRSPSVALRILFITLGLALLLAMSQSDGWADVTPHMMKIAVMLTPILLASLVLLWAAQPWLSRLDYWHGVLAVNVSVVVLTLATYYSGSVLYSSMVRGANYFDAVRYVMLSVVICGILQLYFRLRNQLLTRALNEARLQVLRARIRPHFLFNTINAVLGIVRNQPKLAETALEDMADLFRVAMWDEQNLVPIGQELQLSKQYAALEQLRMGERLRLEWQIVDVPDDALIPPLLLQPLLENAVYHGIEPLRAGGCINVVVRRNGDELQLKVDNPCPIRSETTHRGNKIALRNIRERLELLFDVEARYEVENGKDFYRVEIVLPYIRERRRPKE